MYRLYEILLVSMKSPAFKITALRSNGSLKVNINQDYKDNSRFTEKEKNQLQKAIAYCNLLFRCKCQAVFQVVILTESPQRSTRNLIANRQQDAKFVNFISLMHRVYC